MTSPDLTPVLVGVGVATQREEDFRRALEPMDLMLQAVRAAGHDTGSNAALAGTQWIAVPRGRWTYTNPAGAIARAIGAKQATTVLTSVGVLQQTLIGAACARIAGGEAHTTLVAGSDAGYRLLRAQVAGEIAGEHSDQGAPDEFWEPKEELRHPMERRAGLQMPVGLYAIMESAYRHAQGWSVQERSPAPNPTTCWPCPRGHSCTNVSAHASRAKRRWLAQSCTQRKSTWWTCTAASRSPWRLMRMRSGFRATAP